MPYRYPPEFRRKVLDLLPPAGRWRLCQLISVCRTKPFITGAARTLSTEVSRRVLVLRRPRNWEPLAFE